MDTTQGNTLLKLKYLQGTFDCILETWVQDSVFAGLVGVAIVSGHKASLLTHEIINVPHLSCITLESILDCEAQCKG